MDDVREPNMWRRPRSKVYDYNQQFGGTYYLPMLDYLDQKERQGIFFERPAETVHLPDPMELTIRKLEPIEAPGNTDVSRFLTQAYAHKIREQNMATVKTKTNLIKGWTTQKNLSHTKFDNQQTHYNDVRLLKGEVPGRKQVNYYTGQLQSLKVSKDWQKVCTDNHMKDVAAGMFDCESGNYGQGGTPSDEHFYHPQLIKKVVNAIRFKNPERAVPVV